MLQVRITFAEAFNLHYPGFNNRFVDDMHFYSKEVTEHIVNK